MTDVTYTFRVDRALKEAFVAMAQEQDLTAAQILRRLMREAVEDHRATAAHEEWMAREIEAAIHEADLADAPRLSNEAVEDDWERQREEINRRDSE